MICFIGFIVSLGIMMAGSKHQLYEEDYYEKGENYEERIQHLKTGQTVSMQFSKEQNSLLLNFQGRGTYTSLLFRNIADKNKDFMIPGDSHREASQVVDLANLESGTWIVECQGLVNGDSFFKKLEFVK
jgi:hypothetical protein